MDRIERIIEQARRTGRINPYDYVDLLVCLALEQVLAVGRYCDPAT